MSEPAAAAHIVIHVGNVPRRAILATSYGSGGGFDEFMRVCLEHAEQDDKGWLVRAWPDMWLDLAAFLRFHSHHGVNETVDTRRIAQAWSRLARRIDKVLDRVANHPAYRGKSILGVDRTVLSAWKTGKGEYAMTAFAALSRDTTAVHGVLVPRQTIIARRVVTTWAWSPTSDQTGSENPEVLPDPRSA